MDEETTNTTATVTINSATLQSALYKALESQKLSKFDYVLTGRDLPQLQKALEHYLRKQNGENTRVSEIVAQCVGDAASALMEDSFTECFVSPKRINYNNTPFLFLCYLIGVIIRWCILLPLRMSFFAASVTLIGLLMTAIRICFPFNTRGRKVVLLKLYQLATISAITSFNTIILQHGKLPDAIHECVYVANHTTTQDPIILSSIRPFSLIGQKHTGLQGFLQSVILGPIDGLWFERKSRDDRISTLQAIHNRVQDKSVLCPLLIFPEGVCVNNRFIMQFKRGAFDLNVPVYPIAIKYAPTSTAAFQNSKKMSFIRYLVSLWTQWALVVDIYYLPAMTKYNDETVEQFAHRVQLKIAKAAQLKPRSWDGYLKYIEVSQKMILEQKEIFAKQLGLIDAVPGDEETSYSFSHHG